MFQQPSQGGDRIEMAGLVGSLVLVYVREYRDKVTTSFGESDAVAVDLHVLDGKHAGESFENSLLFQRALVGALRGAVGGDPVLGRIGQGVAKPGQSPAYILNPFTDADAALATAWINARPKFQAAGNGNTGATPAAAMTTGATPAAAVTTTAPANGGMTAEAFAALPPEVQELLRQSAQAVSA